MKDNVDKELLKKADKCPHDFICQAADEKPRCTISETVNGKVHFLECRSSFICNYQRSFGSSFICACPVRQEIYKKQGI